jgi:hypothetical protein
MLTPMLKRLTIEDIAAGFTPQRRGRGKEYKMRRAMIVGALAALAAAFGAGTASAANVQVGLANCYYSHSGSVTVPAGSTVTFFIGFVTVSRGAAKDFEKAQTTTATLNGSAVPNASSLFAAPVLFPANPPANPRSYWVAPWFLSAGTLVNAGEQTAVTNLQISLSHPVAGGFDPTTQIVSTYPSGDLLPAGFGCTVTAT